MKKAKSMYDNYPRATSDQASATTVMQTPFSPSQTNGHNISIDQHTGNNILHALFRTATFGVVLIDSQGYVLEANPAFATLLGYTLDELIGQRYTQFTHPDDIITDSGLYAGLLNEEYQSYTFDKRYLHKQGTTIWVHLSVSLSHDDTEHPQYAIALVEDITARKQAEEQLRWQAELLQMISNSAPIGLLVVDNRTDEITYSNHHFCELWGITHLEAAIQRGELRNKDIIPYCLPLIVDVPAFAASYLPLQDEHNRMIVEDDIAFTDGRTIRRFSSQIRDTADTYFGRVYLFKDISESKQLEHALRASETKYKTLFHILPIGISITDPNGQLIEANPISEALLGISIDEHHQRRFDGAEWQIIRPDGTLMPPEEYASVRALNEQCLVEDVEMGIRRPDGATSWLSVTATPIPLDECGIAIVYRDITERHDAEQALRESEERLNLVLTGSSDSFWDWDIPSGHVQFSDRWAKILGYAPEEIKPHIDDWQRLVHPDDLPMVLQAIDDHFAGRTEQYSTEHRVRHQTGKWIWILDRGQVVRRTADGTPLRMTGTDTDITGRKQAEEERLHWERTMQETQRLESLGVMAGGIAHDFNNILTSILGNAELALLDAPPDSEITYSVQEIISSTQRAAELTNQMLAYSGHGKYAVRPIVVSDVIQEMEQLLDTLISKPVRLYCQTEPDLPPILGDTTQMQQVIMNLVTNASEAIGNVPGVITIQTTSEHVSARQFATLQCGPECRPGTYVRLTVTDTGSGMDTRTMAHMFDPFFTTKFTGRGLGLAAVQGIVRGHHGALQVSSALGYGTMFSVWLPVTPSAILSPDSQTEIPDSRGTILLIDDEAAVRLVATRMLERIGWSVQAVEDGSAALELLERGLPHLKSVLLDVTMPEMSGTMVAQAIQTLCPEVPIILMSGYDREGIQEYPETLAVAFIQKPFTLTALQHVLTRIMV